MQVMLQTTEGDRILAPPPPIEKLVRHAERFGTGQIVETAIDCGYTFESVVQLQEKVDSIAARKAKEERRYYKRPGSSPERRVKKMMGITDEPEA